VVRPLECLDRPPGPAHEGLHGVAVHAASLPLAVRPRERSAFGPRSRREPLGSNSSGSYQTTFVSSSRAIS
jgi:hypothetical protein